MLSFRVSGHLCCVVVVVDVGVVVGGAFACALV